MDRLTRKYEKLKKIIESYGSLLVAYSGGVDSTLLLKVAADLLGRKALAVTARSATFPREELACARKTARMLAVRHRVIRSEELSEEKFTGNPPDRCYWCKRALLRKLKAIAEREGLAHVAVASHLDDLDDYRPGSRAVSEMGVVSPLSDARLGKADVRRLSKRLGVAGWEREAMACLASRFPYGTRISKEALNRVEAAEAYARRKGFRKVRVRCEGTTARIEVEESQICKLCEPGLRKNLVRRMKQLGFLYVAADLEGYRMGSLNAPLMEEKKK